MYYRVIYVQVNLKFLTLIFLQEAAESMVLLKSSWVMF